MSLKDEVADLALVINDDLVITPCLQLVLYTDGPLGDAELDFYQRAMDAIGANITHYDGVSARPVRMNKRGHSLVPTWLSNPRNWKVYQIAFSGCNRERSVSPSFIGLSLLSRPKKNTLSAEQQEQRLADQIQMYEVDNCVTFPKVNILRVALPIEHELAEPTAFYNWVADFKAIRSPHFCSGHAGIALLADISRVDEKISAAIAGRLGALLLRHPGLDWEITGSSCEGILRWDPNIKNFYPRIKRVNWLTLLGERTLNHEGGIEKLMNQLQTQTNAKLQKIDNSLLIQAGDAPQIGDVSDRDFLPDYRQVAKVLKHLRMDKYGGSGNQFSSDSANLWLAGLDREYD